MAGIDLESIGIGSVGKIGISASLVSFCVACSLLKMYRLPKYFHSNFTTTSRGDNIKVSQIENAIFLL